MSEIEREIMRLEFESMSKDLMIAKLKKYNRLRALSLLIMFLAWIISFIGWMTSMG